MGWIQQLEFVVERREEHWTVSACNLCCGHFPNRRAALAAAVFDAHRVRKLGHEVRVLVRHQDGRLRPVPEALLPPGDNGGGRPPRTGL